MCDLREPKQNAFDNACYVAITEASDNYCIINSLFLSLNMVYCEELIIVQLTQASNSAPSAKHSIEACKALFFKYEFYDDK